MNISLTNACIDIHVYSRISKAPQSSKGERIPFWNKLSFPTASQTTEFPIRESQKLCQEKDTCGMWNMTQ